MSAAVIVPQSPLVLPGLSVAPIHYLAALGLSKVSLSFRLEPWIWPLWLSGFIVPL